MRLKLTTVALALTIATGFTSTLSAQEQPRETAAERADRNDGDDGMDLGWIGLLGLAGLLGLRRRDHVDVHPVVRTDSTTRTDTGYTPTAGR